MKKFYVLLAIASLVSFANVSAQVSLGTINTAYTQDFNTLANTGTSSVMPAGWQFRETGTNADTLYNTGTGSSNAGNTYSFGIAGSSERAIGGIRSGALAPFVGGSFTNNTGTNITSLQISYWGEQWRLGTSGRTDRLDFQYSLNATSVIAGTWVDTDELDFLAPISSGTVGLRVGNDVHANMIHTIAGLNIPPGATFFIRWFDFDASGADDGLSVDDFNLTPIGIPPDQPVITLSPLALNFGSVNVNATDTTSYNVDGSNLTDSISVVSGNPLFTLSLDGITYGNATMLPSSGGNVIVRFSPLVDGLVTSSVVHSSGATTATLNLSGSGFDQASHIIPIATARAQSIGTLVTVAGRVTVGLQLGNPSYIQDATGGIPVFDFALSHTVQIGDTVIVTGPIGVFSQMKQISGSGIFFTIPDSSTRIIPPSPINIADLAANEGRLVTVQSVELVNKAFVFYPQSTERMTNGSIQADLRIDGDTNIPGYAKPQGTVNITGVVGKFNTNAQLLPRFISDIPGSVLPSTPADSIPKTRTLDVANWNLEFFGARFEDYGEEFGPAEESLQVFNARDVINSLDADIIAVEEVSNDSIFAELIKLLPGKAATCSNRYSHSFDDDGSFPPQKLCFIYDTTTVRVLSVRPMFEQLYDQARLTNPALLPGCPGGPSSFYSSGRLPYLLKASVTIEGVTEEVSLVVLHSKSGAAEADRLRRLYDGAVLKDSLDSQFSTDKFIVLGDINDDLDVSITPGAATPYANFVNDTARYSPITKALSDAGARSTVSFQDVIDHQIISNEMFEFYIPGSAQIIAPFTLIPNYANTTSDHLPVISRYILPPTMMTFVESGRTMAEDTSAFVVEIQFNKPLSVEKQVTLSTGGDATYGSDYITSPAAGGNLVLTVPAGATTAQFIFTPVDDFADEVTETALFTLQQGPGLNVGTIPVFAATLTDNDVVLVSFASLLQKAVEGSGPQRINLRLSTPPATDQTVTVRIIEGHRVDYGVDYVTSPPVANNTIQVQIAAGSQQGYFELTPIADNRNEAPWEFVGFQMTQASAGLQMTAPGLSAFTIIDGSKRNPHFLTFPNPTRGQLKLVAEEVEPGETIQAVLRNGEGTTLFSGTGTLDAISDDVSDRMKHQRAGLYTLTISLDGETFVLRILRI